MACDHEIAGCDCAGARDAEIERLRGELERVKGALLALAASVTVTPRHAPSRPITPDWRRFWATGWKARYIELQEARVGPLRAAPTKGDTIAAERAMKGMNPEERLRVIDLYFEIEGTLGAKRHHPLSLLPAAMMEIQAAMNGGAARITPAQQRGLVGQNGAFWDRLAEKTNADLPTGSLFDDGQDE